MSQYPLANGRHEIGLRVKRQGSEISDPALVTDSSSAVPLAPDPLAEPQESVADESVADESVADEPGPPDLPAPEQLAAVAPETPVQSDRSPPVGGTDAAAETAGTQAAAPAAEEAVAAEETPPATAEAAPPAENQAGAAAEIAQPDAAQSAATAPSAETEPPAGDTASATAVATVAAPAPKPEAPARTQTAALPADGDFVIQLASFKDPDTAAREQAAVADRFADLLAGHEVFVQKADLGDQGTFYRVRLGPFASLADARATCSRFQERDRDCLAMAR